MPTGPSLEYDDEEEDIVEERPEFELNLEPEFSDGDPTPLKFTPKSFLNCRPIFSDHQVLNISDLHRGQVLIIKDRYTKDLIVAVLHGSVNGKIRAVDLTTKEVILINLADHSVIGYGNKVWQESRFLVDTGKKMSENILAHMTKN